MDNNEEKGNDAILGDENNETNDTEGGNGDNPNDVDMNEDPKSYYSVKKFNNESVRQGNEVPILQQKQEITTDLLEKKMKENEVWFAIDIKWLKAWKQYVQFELKELSAPGPQHPGPVNNLSLLSNLEPFKKSPEKTLAKLRQSAQEGHDYILICEEIWEKLIKWYGGIENGLAPTIARYTYDDVITTKVELYPFYIRVAGFKGLETVEYKEFRFSKSSTFDDVLDVMKKEFKLEKECRLWISFCGSPYKLPDSNYREIHVEIERLGTEFLIEQKTVDEIWRLDKVKDKIERTKKSHRSISSSSYFSRGDDYYKKNQGDGCEGTAGICGLSNLGNTCFMNSAIQCMTKTRIIRKYFVSGDYENDINVDNPLGMKGLIAKSFGKLMGLMWSGKHQSISPREFKHTIGTKASQFSGYNQQDVAELIAYLLDGIHEDLNRIKDKPVTSSVEGKGRPNDEVADEAWSIHKKRNDSIIVDNFMGLFRSELNCPKCNNISVTFDPFSYLCIPIPGVKTKHIEVVVVYNNNKIPPKKYRVKVPKMGSTENLRDKMSEVTGIKANDLVLTDVFSQRVYKYLVNRRSIKSINDSDKTFAYEVPDLPEGVHKNYEGVMPFGEVKIVMVEEQTNYYHSHYSSEKELSDYPFVFQIENDKTTNKQVYLKCFDITKRYLKPEAKEVLLSKYGIDLDKPETCFECAEDDMQIDENQDPMNIDGDGKEDKDKEDKIYLFKLKFDKYTESYLSSSSEVELKFTDEKLFIPEQKSSSSYHYSSSYGENGRHFKFVMVIPKEVLELVNIEEFEKVEDDESVSVKEEKVVKKADITIDKCIQLFSSKEKLGKDDAWYCPDCKEHVRASKKMEIWKLPNVLIIHLKRFQSQGYYREKISTFVEYPFELKMSNHSINAKNKDKIYDLYAVSNHFGGLGGGHYTAYAKVNGEWCEFDDSRARPLHGKQNVVSSSGYVLFYELRDSTANLSSTSNLKGMTDDGDIKMKEKGEESK